MMTIRTDVAELALFRINDGAFVALIWILSTLRERERRSNQRMSTRVTFVRVDLRIAQVTAHGALPLTKFHESASRIPGNERSVARKGKKKKKIRQRRAWEFWGARKKKKKACNSREAEERRLRSPIRWPERRFACGLWLQVSRDLHTKGWRSQISPCLPLPASLPPSLSQLTLLTPASIRAFMGYRRSVPASLARR